jgi:hypothetical protein
MKKYLCVCASCDLATNSNCILGGIRTLFNSGLNPMRSNCPPHRPYYFVVVTLNAHTQTLANIWVLYRKHFTLAVVTVLTHFF